MFLAGGLALLFAIYWGGLFRGVHVDDNYLIFGSPETRAGNPLVYWFRGQSHTKAWPLLHTLFWMLFRLFGYHVGAYRALNVALHWLAGALSYGFLRRRVAASSAAFAAVFFWLHPVAVETVTWITQVSALITACLLAVWIAKAGTKWELVALVLMVLTKGYAYLLPIASARRRGWRRAVLLLPLGALAAYFLFLAVVGTYDVASERRYAVVYDSPTQPETRLQNLRRRIETCGRTSSHYLVRILSYTDTPISSLSSREVPPPSLGYFLLGLALFALLALALWRNFVLLAAGLLVYLPISGFFYVPFLKFQLVSDHLVYPALLVFAWALAVGLDRISRRWLRKAFWAWPALLAIFTVFEVNAKRMELPVAAATTLKDGK